MTSREGLASAAELFGDEMVCTFERLEDARSKSGRPAGV